MCGLFGVVSPNGKILTSEHKKLFSQNAGLARRRGSDASGLVSIDQEWKIKYVKAWVPVSQLLRRKEIQNHLKQESFCGLFGHSRLETHGFSALSSNNQPIVSKDWFVLHNGIVTNQESIKKHRSSKNHLGDSDSDTFAILLLIEEWEARGRQGDLAEQVFSQCEGELTVIAGSRFGDLIIYTNVGNLYHCRLPDGTTLLGSEPRQFGKEHVATAVRFPLGLTVLSDKKKHTALQLEEVVLNLETRKENGATALHMKDSDLTEEFRQLATELAETAYKKMASVSRCSKCLLPETFPNIKFDINGVCSVCVSFIPPIYPGIQKLKDDLASASPNGKDVLVCLSGGRDSCYILHLVKELGFNPIAYTYDWGMVTTAARENMAKMCGILNVEHILVSPDIQKNRGRVKHALQGWLKRPDIATVPILMAGDKPYFRFAKIVSDERGSLPAVMADHHLETTGFKSMLAGAVPSTGQNGGVEYRLSRKSLLRMAFRYSRSAIVNPTMGKSILVEGAVGFFDYYLRKHTFIRPFMYIPWDEDELEKVLEENYQWSKGNDPSLPAWRMGDATAPFYNLVYGLSLGMTEHDALRSNQIRYGLKSREVAELDLKKDNQVNALALAAYFGTTGLTASESLKALKQMKALI
jgi:glucosamine--fructose-6-phosphate aminotransferase (isomerizing)